MSTVNFSHPGLIEKLLQVHFPRPVRVELDKQLCSVAVAAREADLVEAPAELGRLQLPAAVSVHATKISGNIGYAFDEYNN
jgi:hypothetical protein